MIVGDSTLQRLLEAQDLGDRKILNELLMRACERLRHLARKRLRGMPSLQRWVQTDDVLQNAMLRLHRSLAEVSPASVAEFFGLAALQIRRELCDLHRHYFGPEGVGANHQTDRPDGAGDGMIQGAADDQDIPVGWDRFHEIIKSLPPEQRGVVDCLFVHDLTQEEASHVLGVSLRTVKRRWQDARIFLQKAIEREGAK